MKNLGFLLVAWMLSLPLGSAELSQVQNVYLLPMASGFDQFLANRMTNLGVFQVVTDPQLADAILTEQVGAAFEERLDQLYPPPPPPEAKKSEEEEPAAKIEQEPVVRFRSSGRGKGNVFLVDRKSRVVLWSIHERPKNYNPNEMDKTAEKIVKRLKKDLTGK